MFLLVLLGGTIVVALIGAWLVRGYQRDIDGYEEREFRPPPAFSSPGWQ